MSCMIECRGSPALGRQQHVFAAPRGATPTPPRASRPSPSLPVRAAAATTGCAQDRASFDRACAFSRGIGSKLTAIQYFRAEGALSSSANAHHRRLQRECPVALRRGQTSALCVCRPAAPLAYGPRKLTTKHERRRTNRSDAREKCKSTRSDPQSRVYNSDIGDTPRLR